MLKLIGYNDSPNKIIGSNIVFLYHGNEKYKVLCEVEDSSGHMILGRDQTLRMKYVEFPWNQETAVNAEPEKTIKEIQKEQVNAATEPVRLVIQQSTNSSITINSKTYQLPSTIGYLLKEYADVFQGIGTFPGGEYDIQLKEDYKPVQHPLQQVAVSLVPAYRAELDRLLMLGIITKVRDHTECVNSIVPMKRSDGSLW